MLSTLLALALATAAPTPATNTLCPVLGGKVDANSPKVVVRGREYRICCWAATASSRPTRTST